VGFGDTQQLESEAAWTRATRLAGADELVENLPQRYQTQLGNWFEMGHELSTGEWQKLALARLFMRESADIWVLDEPSASLDAQAEAELLRQFLELTRNRSAILISHRLSTVRAADQILMLDHGRCVERGRHEELLAKSGQYAELFRKQADGDAREALPIPRPVDRQRGEK
jgi:ABC-type multidrug transport system fused ATPase/permease subunit